MKEYKTKNIVYGIEQGMEGSEWGDNTYRASFFYIHGELEGMNGYDICMFSPELLSCSTTSGITICYTHLKSQSEPILSLLFKSYDKMMGGRITGLIVKIDDYESIEECVKHHKNINMYSDEQEFLSTNYRKTFHIIDETFRRMNEEKNMDEKYDYSKLIGYRMDTNQVKSDEIKTEEEAKDIVYEINKIYSYLHFHSVKLTTDSKCFTSYTYHHPDNMKENLSLHRFLCKVAPKSKSLKEKSE